jgi:hypothetical protein
MKSYAEHRCLTGSTRWGFIQQKSAVLRQGNSRKAAKCIDGENKGASERREDILRDITKK